MFAIGTVPVEGRSTCSVRSFADGDMFRVKRVAAPFQPRGPRSTRSGGGPTLSRVKRVVLAVIGIYLLAAVVTRLLERQDASTAAIAYPNAGASVPRSPYSVG